MRGRGTLCQGIQAGMGDGAVVRAVAVVVVRSHRALAHRSLKHALYISGVSPASSISMLIAAMGLMRRTAMAAARWLYSSHTVAAR